MNFFPDPRMLAAQKVTEKGTSALQGVLDDLNGKEPSKSQEEYLKDIHLVLIEMVTWLKNQGGATGDIYKFVTVYKQGFGAPYIPSHLDNRQHFQVFSTANYTLDANASGLGLFTVPLPASTWTNIDFPDGTAYYLDPGAAVNQVTLWQRETNSSTV